MSEHILCPVCEVNFLLKEQNEEGKSIVCPVCGAVLIMNQHDGKWSLNQPADMDPEAEIRQRMDNFARFRGYQFNDMKDPLVEGLIKKRERFGDYYCPCKIDNIPENVCPCLETRKGKVEQAGHCHCGLFWKEGSPPVG